MIVALPDPLKAIASAPLALGEIAGFDPLGFTADFETTATAGTITGSAMNDAPSLRAMATGLSTVAATTPLKCVALE